MQFLFVSIGEPRVYEGTDGVYPEGYSQDDINLLMNHINSYPRKKLNNRSAFDTFSFLHGSLILEKLGAVRIAPDDVTLNPALLRK
jgi:hypothetical protein